MKKILLIVIVLFNAIYGVAQITTLEDIKVKNETVEVKVIAPSDSLPKKVEKIIPYDSLTNIPKLNRKILLKGQTLYYIGDRWDYDNSKYTRYFQMIKENSSFKYVKNATHLRGRYFLINDIKDEDYRDRSVEYWYLIDKNNGDRFRYRAEVIDYEWVCIGHIEKLKSLYVGKEFYLNYNDRNYKLYNVETKKWNYDIPVNSKWKCIDISLDPTVTLPDDYSFSSYNYVNSRILIIFENDKLGKYYSFYHKKRSEIPGETFHSMFISAEVVYAERAEAKRQEELRAVEAKRQEELRAAEAKRQYALRKAKLYKKYGKEISDLILQRRVRIGMTSAMCIESWGRPSDINRTTGSWGVHEQWVYGNDYLYFENGKLTTIQN